MKTNSILIRNVSKQLIFSMIFIFSIVASAFAQRQYFDKSKDLLLAQFDLKPDEDDIHAAAALACMLQHPDLDGINYYAVAGAYGEQNASFITAGIPDYYNLLFGTQNTHWTDAHNERSASVTRIRDKARTILDAGGKVFVQEAGQSDITHDWCKALISDGVDAAVIESKVIVVQHSDWNENSATDSKLAWVKANTDYVRIEDGNGNNATPNYNNKNTQWMNSAKSEDNPNAEARAFWTAADDICDNWTASWENPTIGDGGVDFSDCCENWYIFNIGDDAWTIEKFWNRYVINETGAPRVTFVSPANGSYLEFGLDLEIEVTASDNEGTVSQVEFFDDGSSLGVVNTAPYKITLVNPAEGEHVISATATDDEGNKGSARINVTFTDYSPCGSKLVLSSYDDFPDYNISGFKPAYKDNARHCLAIDASQYKDEYAAAQTIYEGDPGKFNIKINTLLEYDGESTYIIKINGSEIGRYQNPRTTEAGDMTPSSATFEKIDLETGDLIQVEFNSHSNGLIEEGDGFAYSRGRWRSIELISLCLGEPGSTPNGDCQTVWEEQDGILIIEAEDALSLGDGWVVSSDRAGFSGDSYIRYDGPNSMSSVNSSTVITYPLQINTPGTYRLKWHSRNGPGAEAFDAENDSWLMIEGDDFYGMKGGTKTDCKDHYMKVWIQNMNEWSWNCFGEHGANGLNIYATFNTPGVYNLNIAGRSHGHPIDRIALFQDSKEALATNLSTPKSEIIEVGCSTDHIIVEGLTVSEPELILTVGSTALISAGIQPKDATNKSLVWTSSDSTIVSVLDGKITARKTGVAAIKAAAAENPSIYKLVTVVVNPIVEAFDEIVYDNAAINAIYADSEDTERGGGVKERAVDGDPNTFWHTQWFSAQPGLPHEIWFDLGDTLAIDTIDYLPRQDEWGPNGALGQYEIYITNDTLNWGSPLASGEFSWTDGYDIENMTIQEIREIYKVQKSIGFATTQYGRYIKLVALTEAQNKPEVPFTNIAELIFRAGFKGVELSSEEETLTPGESVDLSAEINPVNDPDKYPVNWISTNEAVATVSEGSISAVESGFTFIIASILDGLYTDSCLVTVSGPGDELVGILQDDMAVLVGSTTQLSAMAVPGTETISWKSLAGGVASVTSDGLVTAISMGEAAIVASILSETHTDTFLLSVVEPSLSLAHNHDTLWSGNVKPVDYTVLPKDESIAWESTDKEIATVNDGVIIAKTGGSVKIIASILEGSIADTLDLKVIEPSVKLTPSLTSLIVGRSIQLSAVSTPDTANIVWTSSDWEIASVTQSGLVTTLDEGAVLISASILGGAAQGLSAISTFIPKMEITETNQEMVLGTSYELAFTSSPYSAEVTWISEDEGVATVTEGEINALTVGSTLVTATIFEDVVDSVRITVIAPEVNIAKSTENILEGKAKYLNYTTNTTEHSVSWKSSDETVATVSSTGRVSAKGVGTTTITAWIYSEEYYDECVVTVIEVTGIENGSAERIVQLYPSPTSGLLFITDFELVETICVYGLHGRLLIEKEVDGNMLDISSLEDGLYFVQLQLENKEIHTQHIIKQ